MFKRALVGLAVVWAGVAVVIPAHTSAAGEAISGTIHNALTGLPFDGAATVGTVRAYDASGIVEATSTVQPDGSYALALPWAGTFRVEFFANGFSEVFYPSAAVLGDASGIDVPQDGSVAGIDITTSPLVYGTARLLRGGITYAPASMEGPGVCVAPGVFDSLSCTAGGSFAAFTRQADGSFLVGPLRPGTYTARAAGFNPPYGPWTTFTVNTGDAFQCDLPYDGPAVCTVNGADTSGDSDHDGVSDVIEGAAPNGGDGNGDGVVDAQQANVVSSADTAGRYLTVAGPGAVSMLSLTVATVEATPAPPDTTTVSGMFNWFASLSAGTDTVAFDVYFEDAAGSANSFWSNGVQSSGLTSLAPVGDGRTKATLTLTDGGVDDRDGLVNGLITGYGLFAHYTAPPPPAYGTARLFMGGAPYVGSMFQGPGICPAPGVFSGLSCTTGGSYAGFTRQADGSFLVGPLRPGTYTARAAGLNAPYGPWTTFTVNSGDTFHCDLPYDGPAVCTVNGGDPSGDSDHDGVSDAIEGAAPNGGDGNGDGLADAQQANVVSSADTSGRYVTVAAQPDTSASSLAVATVEATPAPLDTTTVSGALSWFGRPPAGTDTVAFDVYFEDAAASANSYWTNGVQSSGLTSVAPVGDGRTKATLTLTDGGADDIDGALNGVISVSGLFAHYTPPPPPANGTVRLFMGGAPYVGSMFQGPGICPAPGVFSGLSCTAGGSYAAFSRQADGSFTVELRPGTYTARAATAFGSPNGPATTFTVNSGDTFQCDLPYDAPAVCTVTPGGGGGSNDGDGVPASEENAVNPTGDGNGDGTPDAQQDNVTSIPSPVANGGYVTVAAPAGTQLASVTVVDPATIAATPPPGAVLDAGAVSYNVAGVTLGATVDIDVYLTAPTSANGYVKLQGDQWVPLSAAAFTKVSDTHFVLHLTDGGEGDGDNTVDGVISDPGAPALLDLEGPVVTINGVADGASYTLGAVPAASCTASDSGSGLAGTCSGHLSGGTANGVGTFTYTATATDMAGNTSTVTATYRVLYRFDGFLQPINDTAHQAGVATSVFKAGSTVPVKLQLKRADGTVVNGAGAPQWLTPVRGGPVTASINESTYAEAASSGVLFTLSGGQWQYNWSTKGLAAGYYYRIGVLLDDGSVYYVVIALR